MKEQGDRPRCRTWAVCDECASASVKPMIVSLQTGIHGVGDRRVETRNIKPQEGQPAATAGQRKE